MIEKLRKQLEGQKILILGFGQEGRSTFRFIRSVMPEFPLTIADRDESVKALSSLDFDLTGVAFQCGAGYLDNLEEYSMIVKSPGVNLIKEKVRIPYEKLTSQTDLFLREYASRTIGVTGSKGKSTTTSLIHHITSSHFSDVFMAGNIGIPVLDLVKDISGQSLIVLEMSSHQLENLHTSPHIAVLLNIFEEHLDYYGSFDSYKKAKFNIALHQEATDFLVFENTNPDIREMIDRHSPLSNQLSYGYHQKEISFACVENRQVVCKNTKGDLSRFDFDGRTGLPGDHNLMNIMAAVLVAKLLDVPDHVIARAVGTFRGLPHRLEFLGNINGVDFYDDAIATIPEAVIEAIKTLGKVDVLIIGGMDRGINYNRLAGFLVQRSIPHMVFTGEAGRRIVELIRRSGNEGFAFTAHYTRDFADVKDILRQILEPGMTCLLSPAAPSYDCFPGFREKGNMFKSWLPDLFVEK